MGRLQAQQQNLDRDEASFFEDDHIQSIDEIENRLRTERTPEGFSAIRNGSCLLICLVEDLPESRIPQISASITVTEEMEFWICFEGIELDPRNFSHVLKGRIERFSEVANLMAEVKAQGSTPEKAAKQKKFFEVANLTAAIRRSEPETKAKKQD